MKMEFYKCNACGQVIAKMKDTGVDIICCGEPMTKIEPKTKEEGLTEKHLPVFVCVDNRCAVFIGDKPHPSTNDHYIEWIAIKTNMGNQRKCLKPGDAPKAVFHLHDGEEVEEVYAYCNLHSLWKSTKETENCDSRKEKRSCGCDLNLEGRKNK